MRNVIFSCVVSAAVGGVLASSCGAQVQPAEKAADPAKVLAQALKNIKEKDNVELRIQAAMDLADFGAKAEPALADLLDALQTKNEDLRLNAAIALSKIGKASVKPVAALLTSDNLDTKFYAIWTIGWIGPDAKETVPTMIKLMNDKNDGVRRKAAFALGRLAGDPDKTISVLAAAFADENEEVRQAAGDALAKFGKAAVPSLIDLLKNGKTPGARQQASTSLGEIGAEAADAVPVLKELFLVKETDIAPHYGIILAKIGKTSVPVLAEGLKHSLPTVRNAAAQSLQQVGADAVGVLVDGLGDKNVEVRRLSAQSLGNMMIGDKSVVIALAFALSDADDIVRQSAMNGLARLGPQAKLGSAKIREALVDMNQNVRQQAYFLLQQIGEDPRPTLKKGLASKDDKVRINTASLMVSVGFDVKDATPVLLDSLKHEDLGLRMQAAFSLAQRQMEVDKLVPVFTDGLRHKAPGVRIQAVQGLGMLNRSGATVAPKLAEMLNDSEPMVRQHVVIALHNVRGTPAAVVPIMQNVFKDGNADARRSVLQVAWMYGAPAKDIITDGLKDKEISVRQQAVFALQNIQGDLTEALPTLVALMKDKDLGINRQQLVWQFTRAGDGGIAQLGELLKHSEVNIRTTAIQALRNVGPRAAKAMPAVKEAAKDENANIRLHAILILATVGGEGPQFLVKHFEAEKDANTRASLLQNLVYSGQAKHAAPLLKLAMKDSSANVRQACINTLGYFRDSPDGFEVFLLGLKDTDQSVRVQAAHHASQFSKKAWDPLVDALKATKDAGFRQAILIGMMNSQGKSKAAVRPLMDCLQDPNQGVQQWACNLLARIGPDAAESLPALRKISESSPNAGTFNAARAAIMQIEKK